MIFFVVIVNLMIIIGRIIIFITIRSSFFPQDRSLRCCNHQIIELSREVVISRISLKEVRFLRFFPLLRFCGIFWYSFNTSTELHISVAVPTPVGLTLFFSVSWFICFCWSQSWSVMTVERAMKSSFPDTTMLSFLCKEFSGIFSRTKLDDLVNFSLENL